MNNLEIFNFKGAQVRTVIQNDEPWFVAKDVCEFFGDTNYRRSIGRIDEDEKGVSQIATHGGVQSMSIINEAGLYSLLFQLQPQKGVQLSEEDRNEKVEKLREFKRWITHEVIPSIRKHGAYMTPETIEKAILNPDFIINLAGVLKEEQQKNALLTEQIEQEKPKVIFADSVAASNTSILVGEMAKILKQNGIDVGQNRLFAWMRENGYLISRKGTDYNMPTQYSMNLGLFTIKETTINHSDGHVSVSKTVKVSGKGQLYFVNKFLNPAA